MKILKLSLRSVRAAIIPVRTSTQREAYPAVLLVVLREVQRNRAPVEHQRAEQRRYAKALQKKTSVVVVEIIWSGQRSIHPSTLMHFECYKSKQ